MATKRTTTPKPEPPVRIVANDDGSYTAIHRTSTVRFLLDDGRVADVREVVHDDSYLREAVRLATKATKIVGSVTLQ